MAKITNQGEPDSDEYEIDNRVMCPKCGFDGCEIITMPRGTLREVLEQRASWFAYQDGEARCQFCGIRFPIRLEDEPEEDEGPQWQQSTRF